MGLRAGSGFGTVVFSSSFIISGFFQRGVFGWHEFLMILTRHRNKFNDSV